MIPKEKAIELYYKFTCCAPLHSDNMECALIAVDEILKSIPCIPSPIPCEDINDCIIQAREFWQKVKKEIKSL